MATYGNGPQSVGSRSDTLPEEEKPASTEAPCRNAVQHGLVVRRLKVLSVLAACAGAAATLTSWTQRNSRERGIVVTSRPAGVALVPGSGGFRGHAHIGVIRVLDSTSTDSSAIPRICAAGTDPSPPPGFNLPQKTNDLLFCEPPLHVRTVASLDRTLISSATVLGAHVRYFFHHA